jgi:hypothetical protein
MSLAFHAPGFLFSSFLSYFSRHLFSSFDRKNQRKKEINQRKKKEIVAAAAAGQAGIDCAKDMLSILACPHIGGRGKR